MFAGSSAFLLQNADLDGNISLVRAGIAVFLFLCFGKIRTVVYERKRVLERGVHERGMVVLVHLLQAAGEGGCVEG